MLAKNLQGAAAAAVANPVYIEDVFSTWLYTGNGSTQTITNGIDLSGKGGLVWTKSRSAAHNNGLVDSARGSFLLNTNTTGAQQALGASGLTLNSNGYTINNAFNTFNESSTTYVSWTFRKQAKFFDVVTYTGNGSGAGQNISHSLASKPGFIIVKRTNASQNWFCLARADNSNYYTSASGTADFGLNRGSAGFLYTDQDYATTTTFNPLYLDVGNNTANINGATYVAYLFAHNAGGFGASGSDNVISCGSYTGNGSTTGPVVTLGYEPQWLLIKKATASGSDRNWWLTDTMRGFAVGSGADTFLFPNSSAADSTGYDFVNPTATGFDVTTSDDNFNTNGITYIYIAIRRGPMKTPTSGTSVYNGITRAGTSAAGVVVTGVGFPPDISMISLRQGTSAPIWFTHDRLRGAGSNRMLSSSMSQQEGISSYGTFVLSLDQNGHSLGNDNNLGTREYYNNSGYTYIDHFFRRAPGFFDVVCYTGTGANGTVSHNLGVVPELILVKQRSASNAWQVYSAGIANTEYLVLSTTAAKATGTTRWNSTSPTTSVFSLGTAGEVNTSTATYVAYLFATVAGVSKVGSYTGNGSNQTINCGFTGGARFILIKRTDSTGDWYVWDTARGIVSGNDPHLSLNSITTEVTTDDSVDTDSSGFIVNQLSATNINVNAATYIFLAIA